MLERDRDRYSSREKHEGFFTGLYRRNEIFLIASAGIFLTSMFVGYFLSGFFVQYVNGAISSSSISSIKADNVQKTISIFLENLKSAFLIYVGGITVGIVTAIFLISGGILTGYEASQFPIGNFIVYKLPHGIFEIVGIIIAGTAGFRLASVIFNFLRNLTHIKGYLSLKKQLEQIMYVGYDDIKESIILFILSVIFIFIGAVIEANFAVTWGNFITGML